ncbi:MAG: CoA transferase [Dehalococcoidales bacterium]|jgi:crotonobetainyl-CoA:carnitine CoA-transferase CaiB-like acyl-CoA transferase
MERQALSDVKVVEFSDFVSGPYCGKLMANMGAQVIKVEKPGSGDKARSWGPFPENLPHPEKSGLFLFLNTNKKGITLNVESAAGKKIFKELLKWADVLIEDHAVKEMAALGLSYPEAKEINPALVMTSITPFGQTGPFKDYKGSDLISFHASSEAFGNPDEGVKDTAALPPLKVANHAADFMSGLTAAACTLGALIGRGDKGRGQHIDVSRQEALASICRQQLAYYSVMEENPSREFGRKKFGGFLYPCKDGYVVIWIGPHYHLVVKMMGDPEWSKEEMFANPLLRNGYIVELNQLITVWTLEHTAEEVNALALEHGVPCSLVRSVEDLVGDEQLAFRDFWREIDHAIAGKLKYPGAPFKLSATPAAIERPAPLLGEHNEMVYCGMLKYTREQLVRMRQGGII